MFGLVAEKCLSCICVEMFANHDFDIYHDDDQYAFAALCEEFDV